MGSFTHSLNRLIYHLICLCLCACHRLPPKVGRRANHTCPRNDGLWGQEWANQGKKLGKTKGWIAFPVPGEGTTDDIVVTSNEIGIGNSKFCGLCFSLRTADVFPVVSLSLRRERSDDRKYARLQLAGYLCLRSCANKLHTDCHKKSPQ